MCSKRFRRSVFPLIVVPVWHILPLQLTPVATIECRNYLCGISGILA